MVSLGWIGDINITLPINLLPLFLPLTNQKMAAAEITIKLEEVYNEFILGHLQPTSKLSRHNQIIMNE